MSEQVTEITLRGSSAGFAEYGRKTTAEMVAVIRAYAERQKAEAEAVLAAQDVDFHVCTYRGVHVRRDRIVLQEGRPLLPPPSDTGEGK